MIPAWPLVALGAVTAACLLAGCGALRGGYESAPYTVIREDGSFQIRDYPAIAIVETPMSNADSDGSFGRLFRFISGRNEAAEKIPMTTPVFMDDSRTVRTMAFVMPAAMKIDRVPRPADASVSVRELPAGRFAVRRFSGSRSSGREAEELARLRAWMETAGLKASSAPIYGYFDPPWTPSFLRRNEVMLRLD